MSANGTATITDMCFSNGGCGGCASSAPGAYHLVGQWDAENWGGYGYTTIIGGGGYYYRGNGMVSICAKVYQN